MVAALVPNFSTYFKHSILSEEIAQALQFVEVFFRYLIDKGLEESLQMIDRLIARFNIGRQYGLTCRWRSFAEETKCWRSPMYSELFLSVRVMQLLLIIAKWARHLLTYLSASLVEADGVLPKSCVVGTAGFHWIELWQFWQNCALLLRLFHNKL